MLPDLKPSNRQSSAVPYAPNVPPLAYEPKIEKPTLSKSQYGRRRSNILIEATKDFCRLERPADTDIYTFKEFFYQFIENLGVADKRVVSAMLARMNYTPRSIALYLSMDVLEVAAPFLLFSPALGESDLKAIGQKMGIDYKRVMKRRRGETLVTFDFPELEEAKVDKVMQAVESTRAAIADEMYISAPKSEEQHSKSNALSGDEIMALASSGGRLGRGKVQQSEKRQDKAIAKPEDSLDALYALARASDIAGFAKSATDLTGLAQDEILKLIKSDTGDEIVYFIKALDYRSTKDIQMLLMLCPRFGRQLDSYKSAKALFEQLEVGICQMIFNQVGAKFQIKGSPEPMEIEGNRTDQGFARAIDDRRNQISYSRAELTSRKNAREVFGRKAS